MLQIVVDLFHLPAGKVLIRMVDYRLMWVLESEQLISER